MSENEAGLAAAGPLGQAPPQRLVAGRYRLVRVLGRGGMGTVWLAEDELVGRAVAVKELRPPQGLGQADWELYGRRALQEARSAARIRHPNAVTLYDVLPASAADEAVYLIMELLDGPTLAQLIGGRGPLPAAGVAACGLQLLSVLEAAHALGIVHRDIKPANIIMAGGQAKLTDFGIAHTIGDARLTRSGVMGTQAYMAPELFESDPITAAADLWSLGATLYYAAEGRGPFDRGTTGATLRAILVDELPAPACPAALAAAITGLLQRDPARRATIGQARGWLLQASAASPGPVRPAATGVWVPGPDHTAGRPGAGPRPTGWQRPSPAPGPGPATTFAAPWQQAATTRSPGLPPRPAARPVPGPPPPGPPAPGRSGRSGLGPRIAAAAALVAAAIIVPVLTLSRTHQPPAPSHHNPARPSASSHHNPAAPAAHPAESLTDPGSASSFPSGAAVTSAAFSPDGKLLAVGDGDNSAYVWDLATGHIVATVTGSRHASATSVAFSPDGQMLATGAGNGSTYLWDVATSRLVATVTDPERIRHSNVTSVAFSPDGQMLATGDKDDSTYLWDVATGQLAGTLTDPGTSNVDSVAFSPDGQMLAVGDSDGSTYLWDVATGKLAATLTDPGGGGVNAVAFSPDGQTLAAGDIDDSTYLWDVASSRMVGALTDPGGSNGYVNAVAFSPDGQTLAAGDNDDSTYLWDVASSRIVATLTDPGGSNSFVNAVAFSPDGQTLATGDEDDSTYLWDIG
jgi:eukaryotic-like serine/threonine-protein kinase